jgi:hypothetical protein
MSPPTAQHVIWLILAVSVSSAMLTAWFADRKGLNVAFWGLAGLVLFVLALAVVILTPSQREPGSRPNARAIPQRQPRERAKRRVWWLASGAPRPRVAGEAEESS